MKKRTLLILVLSAFLLASVLPTLSLAESLLGKDAIVANISQAYLTHAAYSQYYCKHSDLNPGTLLAIDTEDQNQLVPYCSDLDELKAQSENTLFEYSASDYTSIDALCRSLILHHQAVEYYAFLNEVSNTTYLFLDLSYTVFRSIDNSQCCYCQLG